MLRSPLVLIFGVLGLAAMARALWWIARGTSITPMPRRSEFVAAITSFALALAVSLALLVVPTYKVERSTIETSSRGTFTSKTVENNQTLLQVNGVSTFLDLAIPVLLTGLPLLFRRSRWRFLVEAGAAILLTALSIIAGFTIGLFYLPSALAMLVAALLSGPARASA